MNFSIYLQCDIICKVVNNVFKLHCKAVSLNFEIQTFIDLRIIQS